MNTTQLANQIRLAQMNTTQLANQMHLVQSNTTAGKATQLVRPKALATQSLGVPWVCLKGRYNNRDDYVIQETWR
jgi:hypothetical protein